ncbi:MAG: hypothetical protein BM556_15575 [Bacteriovorax sp. MedPE-SWde]|nr:MAG: hypothetical protein BM556_15575 [Bacteriovorax sp. MedPE-SWde]
MKSFKVLGMTLAMVSALSSTAADTMRFSRACEGGKSITISAVGDILLHETLQRRAIRENSFEALWQDVIPYFENADYSYGNLESPAAKGTNKKGERVKDPGFVYDGKVYSSYPRFNYNPKVIRDLKNSGLDIISTANNHSLDRWSRGVDQTIKEIEKQELEFIGTRLKKKERRDKLSDWYRVTDIDGVKVAWIGCTFFVNYGLTDKYDQVMYCESTKGKKRIKSIIEKLKDKTDAIIITPHWGKEYVSNESKKQRVAAHKWINMGATAVIGSHPHVLQPMEKVERKDGSEGFIIYSLGNFASNQGGRRSECKGESKCLNKKIAQRASVVLFLGLTKNENGTFINGVKALPTRMVNQYDTRRVELEIINKDMSEFDEELAVREELSSPKRHGDGRRELKHIKSVLPAGNLIFPDEEVLTNSECM